MFRAAEGGKEKGGSMKAEPLSELVITILSVSSSSINSWIVNPRIRLNAARVPGRDGIREGEME